MSYNKAKEEAKWLQWKKAEEAKMRDLGTSEATIKEIHEYDWEMFKNERNHIRHTQEMAEGRENAAAQESQRELHSTEDLLDEIENERLYEILRATDILTLQILLQRMDGFSIEKIAEQNDMTPQAVYQRLYRLRKKIKNIFDER